MNWDDIYLIKPTEGDIRLTETNSYTIFPLGTAEDFDLKEILEKVDTDTLEEYYIPVNNQNNPHFQQIGETRIFLWGPSNIEFSVFVKNYKEEDYHWQPRSGNRLSDR